MIGTGKIATATASGSTFPSACSQVSSAPAATTPRKLTDPRMTTHAAAEPRRVPSDPRVPESMIVRLRGGLRSGAG